MRVSFWFDPVCPFCWITSRWILDVAPERDLEIDWQPISLFFKNDPEPGTRFYEPTIHTRNLLRVVESLRAGGQTDRIGAFYTELGRKIHQEKNPDIDVAALLTLVGADPAHAAAYHDERFDDAIRAAMADGLALAGDDVGTPILALENRAGTRTGGLTMPPDDKV